MLKDFLKENSKVITFSDEFCFYDILEKDSKYRNLDYKKKKEYEQNIFKKETKIEETENIILDDWYKLNNEWYLFKVKEQYYDSLKEYNEEYSLNELLGEYISIYFNLSNAHYEIGRLVDEHEKIITTGLLSKNFYKGKYQYKKLKDYPLLKKNTTIIDKLEIFNKLKYLDLGKSTLYLEKDLKKLFIRDFLTSEFDRASRNLLFMEDDNNIMLAPIFDNEESFVSYNKNINLSSNCLGYFDVLDKECQIILREDLLFQESLNKLMNFNMNNTLSTLENEHRIIIPNNKKEHYINHVKKIKRLVKENNLVKKL